MPLRGALGVHFGKLFLTHSQVPEDHWITNAGRQEQNEPVFIALTFAEFPFESARYQFQANETLE